jgi:hypothetical protein
VVNIELSQLCLGKAYLNLGIDSTLLIIELVIIVRVHLQVVEGELLLDALLERLTLLEGERVGLGNNGNNVDDIGQLLQNNDIDGLETMRGQWVSPQELEGSQGMGGANSRMAGGLDEEQAAVNASILDVTLALSGEFLAEVC